MDIHFDGMDAPYGIMCVSDICQKLKRIMVVPTSDSAVEVAPRRSHLRRPHFSVEQYAAINGSADSQMMNYCAWTCCALVFFESYTARTVQTFSGLDCSSVRLFVRLYGL